MTSFLQQVINGISLGSIYALIALGYTMVYGVLRLINFAHGDVYMFGAFMGYYVAPFLQNRLVKLSFLAGFFAEGSVVAAIFVMVASMLLCSLLGIVIERFAYRPGRGGYRFAMAFWLGVLGAAIGYFIRRTPIGICGGVAIGVIVGILLEYLSARSVRRKYRIALIVSGLGLLGLPIGYLVEPNYVGIWSGLASGVFVGFVLESLTSGPVPRASRLALLIIAIGVSSLMENGGQLVFGADPKFFPQIIVSRQLNVGALSIDNQKVIVLVVALVLMILLNLLVHYTKTGKAMRAVSFNLDAAKLMGINTDRIIAFTFALGSALAAAGGILVSLNYPKIEPLMGIRTGISAFVAAVLGGIGNITGAVIGGFVIALAEVMVVGYGQSTYRDAVAFSLLILILLFRPAGIMGKGLVEKV